MATTATVIWLTFFSVFGAVLVAAAFLWLVLTLKTTKDTCKSLTLELEKANSELARVADEATQSSIAKTNFLAVMSHELRTPLAAIMGYVEIVCMGVHGKLEDPVVKDLERALKSANHLLSLINGILDFTKLERGTLEVRSAVVPLNPRLLTVYELFQPILMNKGQYWSVSGPIESLKVRGDGGRIQQILVDLVSNAVKFTPRGGSISLRAWEENRNVFIDVEDNGIGISPAELAIIFDPFVQLDAGMTRMASGTGLGLTIARELAQKMGGSLTCTSTKGVGSVFHLCLPSVINLD